MMILSVRARLLSVGLAIIVFTLLAMTATHLQKDGGILHRLSFQQIRDIKQLDHLVETRPENAILHDKAKDLAQNIQTWGASCTLTMTRPVGLPLRLLAPNGLVQACQQSVQTAEAILQILDHQEPDGATGLPSDAGKSYSDADRLAPLITDFNRQINQIDSSVNILNSRLVIALTSLLWMSGLVTTLYSAWTALFIANRVGRLHASVQELARGEIDTRISSLDRSDEFGDFARTLDRFRQSAQQLKAAEMEALSASRSKSQFLAMMSHELRTPLNAIIGFADLIRVAKNNTEIETLRSYAGFIHESGLSLQELIDNLLDISKIEAGRYHLREERLYPGDVIRDVISLHQMKADAKSLAIIVKLPLEAVFLCAERRALRVILSNLLDNAIKFSPEKGSITISARYNETGYRIDIRDQGEGIPQQAQDLVFEPFKQLDDDLARKAAGTGTGLPLVRRLMHLHDGEAWLSSETGSETSPGLNQRGGTIATVLFPPQRLEFDPKTTSPSAVMSS
ncbi:sensor histidine kinase [Iodidimonas nitroreducens]|uniref:sensor histidine kinase n=1 Tax=Iodidimonas nitroreducens TaxID=1236968 RepID=UPI000694B6B0|nr:HAMP domain-containing sensor histidine kinase [Iodidimonas nitroreducens]